jgi:exodeoxyribonuclease VII small subunit
MAQTNPANKVKNATSQGLPPDLSEMKFEAALAELEQIVQNMEGGGLPLEKSIAAYRRGSELLRHCQQQLSDAERKIQILEEETLRDFDKNNGIPK